MSLRKRFTNAWNRERSQVDEEAGHPSAGTGTDDAELATTTQAVDQDQPNLAARYGVAIDSMLPREAHHYWRVKRVRHLTPEENEGRHHIFVQAHFADIDEPSEARVLFEWEDSSTELKIERGQREPAISFAMYTWQTCRVSMAGQPSEAVVGLTANHPDELNEDGSRSGNTLFHHSFLVEFEEVVVAQRLSQIQGVVLNGADLTLQLVADGQVLGEGPIPPSGEFRFKNVAAGTYVVQVSDPDTAQVLAMSKMLEMDGVESMEVTIEVSPPAAEDATEEIQPESSEPVPDPEPSAQSTPQPPVQQPPAEIPPLGIPMPPSSPEKNAPVTPVPVQPMAQGAQPDAGHYVLFGPPDHFATNVYLSLLKNQLTHVRYGFNPEEASAASRVTILASPDVVPMELDASLQAKGIPVNRVYGDLNRIKTAVHEL